MKRIIAILLIIISILTMIIPAAFATTRQEELTHAFVYRCYQGILGRDPDQHGLEFWMNKLLTKEKTASEIIQGFVESVEFKSKNLSNSDAIEILYKVMLGRGSDPGGKSFWLEKMNNGTTYAGIINGFCGSKEFTELCELYGITPGRINEAGTGNSTEKVRAFVTRCYNIILGRGPDPEGLTHWTNLLLSKQKDAAEIIHGFIGSVEFNGKNYSNSEAVEILYKTMLGRGSDPEGKKMWVREMDEGNSLISIINGFCGSTEFKNICKDYGINPGSVQIVGGYTGVNLSEQKKINNEFIAWITIPGTKVNYPVVLSDNVSWYMNHTFTGKKSKDGALISLGKCNWKKPAKNIVIYGHHVEGSGDRMFKALLKYKKESYYSQHQYIYLDSMYRNGKYKIFAVFDMIEGAIDPSKTTFGSDQEFLNYVNNAKRLSKYNTNVEVTKDDTIVTLVTCDRYFKPKKGRLIVMAVKVN